MASRTVIGRSRRQSGASLVMSLIILIVMMLLGATAMSVSNTQFKQAGNIQFQNSAFNQAEAALADASAWLIAGTNFKDPGFTSYDAAASPQRYPIDYLTTNGIDPLAMTWSGANSLALDGAGTQRYIMEKVAANKSMPGTSLAIGGLGSSGCHQADLFRIMVRGGSTRGAVKFIQTYHSVLSC